MRPISAWSRRLQKIAPLFGLLRPDELRPERRSRQVCVVHFSSCETLGPGVFARAICRLACAARALALLSTCLSLAGAEGSAWSRGVPQTGEDVASEACDATGHPDSCPTAIRHVATNADLTSLSSSFGVVYRDGYFTRGDTPLLMYRATAAACPLANSAGDGGSQVPTRDGKCWLATFPGDGPDLRQFGARGDGRADDTIAIQKWVDYLYRNERMGRIPTGSFKLSAPIFAPPANNWGWKGEGRYKSNFFYSGENRSVDIFSFGSTSGDSRAAQFESFSVFSYVPMTGGATFKLTNFVDAVLDDVAFGGELYARNTWDGIWFNGAHEVMLTRFDVEGRGDGIVVNGGSPHDSSNSDLYLNIGFSNRNGGAGIRQAGGFGGLNIAQVQLLGNEAGQLIIDNSRSKESNRETILGANFVADGVLSTQDDIILNSPYSSSANLLSAGTIGSAARYGINIVSWPKGYINISAGRLYNNRSDAIHVIDLTTTLICGAGASVDSNGGLGINSSEKEGGAYISCPQFGNGGKIRDAPSGD